MISRFEVPSVSDKTGPLYGAGTMTLYLIEMKKENLKQKERLEILEAQIAN